MRTLANGLEVARAWVQKLGPYLVLEIVLPGGTLLALLLFLYRRGRILRAPGQAAGICR